MKTIILFTGFCLIAATGFTQTYDSVWVNSASLQLQSAYNTGDYQQCEDLNIRILDTARTRYGAESREATEILFSLSEIQKLMGDLPAAEQSITECLANWRKLYGDQHPNVAMALNQLGYCRYRLGKLETVEKLMTDAWQIFVDLGMSASFELSSLASDMAAYYQSQGLLLKAEQKHLEAIQIARAVPDMPQDVYGVLLNNIAVFYSDLQRNEQAIRYMDDYLKILENELHNNHPAYLKALGNKGAMLMDAGNYNEARTLLESTLHTARKIFPPGDTQLAFHLRKLATFYLRVGQNEDAVRLREESLALIKNRYGDAHPEYGAILSELAGALSRCNRLAETDTLTREAIRIMERENRTQTFSYAQSMINLGGLYQRAKRFDLARPMIEKGARLGEKLLGAENPGYYLTFGSALAGQYLLENQPDSALRVLDALQTPIQNAYGAHHQLSIKLETQYGKAWQLKGDASRALQYFNTAFTALQDNMAENFRYLSINEREKFAHTFEAYRTAALAAARAFPNDANISAFLFDLTLFQKELLASYDRQLLAGWQQNADSTYFAYTELRRMIARQWTLPVKERLDLPELETQRAVLEKTLALQLAKAPEAGDRRSAHWQQVQQILQPGDAAIEWLSLPPGQEGRQAPCYAALLLRPGFAAPQLVLLSEEAQVDSLFASKGSRGLQYATRTYTGDALYRALWRPLEAGLGGVQRVFYAPTGALHLLNFDAIQAPGGQLLSDKYRLVRVTNTARLLDAGFGQHLAAAGSALLAGGLNYESASAGNIPEKPDIVLNSALWRGGTSVREWAALPNTLPEVENLAALLQQKKVQVTLLTGTNGSETAVKERCSAAAPGILHFATHGFFFEKNTAAPGGLGLVAAENPMFRSGLILAGANPAWRGEPGSGNADDGILTADEISLLPLRNTALVVLSACETGLGDVRDDEGVYGLQRAFRLAGAQNIVMSLWRVPDVQTRQFMEKFYAALLKEGDTRLAIRNAREAMRKEYGNPYYWAGFILLE